MGTEEPAHSEWSAKKHSELANANQVWIDIKSNFFCTHFLTKNVEPMYKQIKVCGTP